MCAYGEMNEREQSQVFTRRRLCQSNTHILNSAYHRLSLQLISRARLVFAHHVQNDAALRVAECHVEQSILNYPLAHSCGSIYLYAVKPSVLCTG